MASIKLNCEIDSVISLDDEQIDNIVALINFKMEEVKFRDDIKFIISR